LNLHEILDSSILFKKSCRFFINYWGSSG